MDRISCLAFLLYHSNGESVKNVAIKLAVGDISLKELKRDKRFSSYVKTAEQTYKKTKLNKEEVCRFLEEYICI